jgi:uncharacterized protein YebE (UPF0316 family)
VTILITSLIIMIVRIIDVSMGTLRTVLIVRGKRVIGAFIGFVEVLIWFLVVRQALTAADISMWIAIAYAAGFAIGTFVGSWIEERLAIGNASINVITRGKRNDLVKELRDKGFAVSTVITQGKDQENLLLMIEINRKMIDNAIKIINDIAPDSFVTISDVRHSKGGYFPRNIRR